MLPKFFEKHDLPLTEYQLELQQRNRRRIVVIATAVIVLLIIGYFSARPALRAVHGFQARRHAQKAFAYIEQEKWNEARTEAFAAYQLRPNEPEAIRSIAVLFSRAGQPDGLKFWKEFGSYARLTRADLREEAGLALKVRELDLAGTAIKELLSKRDGGATPADYLLAAQLALQQQDLDSASIHIREVFGSTSATDRDQFQATLVLDAISRIHEGKGQDEVLQRFAGLAHGSNSVSLDALVVLAQHFLGSNTTWPNPAGMSIDDIIHALEVHPLAKAPHKLLAADLKIRQHPEEREALIQNAIAEWKGGDNATLIALAAWLNTNKEYQRELDSILRQRAMQTRELFFQHVDALGALGRWDEIRRLIESEQFPLDPVVEHMYLARCFAQQNQSAGAENNWTRALQAAAGDLAKLMVLAEYAEKNGALDVANAAYEAAVAAAPKSRVAQQGRLRIAYNQRNTKKIHSILVELLKLWPNDPAVQNDEAYTRLLLLPSLDSTSQPSTTQLSSQPSTSSETPAPSPPTDGLAVASSELSEIEHLAQDLVQKEPASLPHRTLLALARLKQNRPQDALTAYQDINVPQTALTTSSLVVHSAVLAALGHQEEARKEFSNLPLNKLLPEERVMDPDNTK